MPELVTNVVVAGLGGEGVIRASDILADAAFRAGYDVKKAEVHGMSQRGGSVSSDVRFGSAVLSPMVPGGEADYLVVLSLEQVEANRYRLRPDGVLLTPDAVDAAALQHRRTVNVALLGMLSRDLPIDGADWRAAIEAHLPESAWSANYLAFAVGRETPR